MKRRKIFLITLITLFSFITVNTNFFIYADEKTSNSFVSQKIALINENGELISDFNDTLSFGRIEEQTNPKTGETIKVNVPIYKLNSLETRTQDAYNLNDSYSEIEFDENGSLEVSGLREGETYTVQFDNEYVFKSNSTYQNDISENKDENFKNVYHMYASFVAGENEEIVISRDQYVEY